MTGQLVYPIFLLGQPSSQALHVLNRHRLIWQREVYVTFQRVLQGLDWEGIPVLYPLQYKFQRWRISKVHCRRRVSDFT